MSSSQLRDIAIEVVTEVEKNCNFRPQRFDIRSEGPYRLVRTEGHEVAQRTMDEVLARHEVSYYEYSEMHEQKKRKVGDHPSVFIYKDPIDGSIFYQQGDKRHVASCILICDLDYRPLAAAVADFGYPAIYSADSAGAYKNDEPIQPAEKEDLNYAFIATYSVKPEFWLKQPILDPLAKAGANIFNAANAVDECKIAEGIYHAAAEFIPVPKTEAAGLFIAQQAGAIVSDIEGNSYIFNPEPSTKLIACTEKLRKAILDSLNAK
jgi:fructose-1,6-bisphosphatase/inositol monophosphatase family enzyme